jgi:Icc-related predicted phosphoesterase
VELILNNLRIVAISDTHNYHDQILIPECDLLIHSGDLTSRGKTTEIRKFLDWFEAQPAKHKVFIAGNHDWGFQTDSTEIEKLVGSYNVTYLNESSVNIEGLNIYGSPWTPWFHDWAFNGHAPKMRRVAFMIPDDTDILITHGPPLGVMDRVERFPNPSVGCNYLWDRVCEIKPKLHVFGHIHEAAGVEEHTDTLFVNASTCNLKYQAANKPVETLYLDGKMEVIPPGFNFVTWQGVLGHIDEA